MASYVDMLGFLNLPGPNPDVSQENIARLREAGEARLGAVAFGAGVVIADPRRNP